MGSAADRYPDLFLRSPDTTYRIAALKDCTGTGCSDSSRWQEASSPDSAVVDCRPPRAESACRDCPRSWHQWSSCAPDLAARRSSKLLFAAAGYSEQKDPGTGTNHYRLWG